MTTLTDLRERRQVTSSGGNQPVFSRDGRELFLSGQRDSAGLTHGQLNVGPSISGFDVAADGRLLMTRSTAPAPGDEARAVLRQNWMAALGK